MSDFPALARDRHSLQEFCKNHVSSVLAFQSGSSFKLNLQEADLDVELHHLTSTSTCIESLLDCPEEFRPREFELDPKLAQDFAVRAINRKAEKWKSEGSAGIYCRCRALPFVVRHLPNYDRRLGDHLKTILKQLEKSGRFAVGEADPKAKREEDWYPPNAFHTYWFLSFIQEVENRFNPQFKKLNDRFSLDRRKDEMLLWARSVSGRQISLHAANSSTLDSDQLAWSLGIVTRFGSDFQSNLADQDFICEGLKALFSRQTKAGTWQHGQPLFHYRDAGNAYCYVYETFTILLKTVLERENEGEFLRSALEPFFPKLIDLWKYALSTMIPLSSERKKSSAGKIIGWSSGHRIDHLYAESWATASVFSYTQALRRLVGVWTGEEALRGLNQVSTFSSRPEADKQIRDRGDTWPYLGAPTSAVAEQLVTLFVNPTRKVENHGLLEPDRPPIQEQQARSAILFGPPGTSKTNLARAVAGAVGWQYIELHASHFVAEGLPAVQHTADEIFQKLMELDHAVILFDEIDELVRERDVEPDAFGRFLTTSMLPKLAELWKLRKVIYFIATNHIEYFDRAVTRAERFDALIFVTPPSFAKKAKEVKRLLSKMRGISEADIELDVTFEQVKDVLSQIDCERGRVEMENAGSDNKGHESASGALPDEQVLAKFALLRWDQLHELAFRLSQGLGGNTATLKISEAALTSALKDVSDRSLQLRKTYCDYEKAVKYVSRDYGKDIVWEVADLSPAANYVEPLSTSNGRVWLTCVERPEKMLVGAYNFEVESVGKVSTTSPVSEPSQSQNKL